MNKAFTLVELAIVIVIIGLLVGGVFSGQELIRQAKIRAAIKDYLGFEAAVTVFKGKYNCLPSDCLQASRILHPDAINGDGDGWFGNFNTQAVRAWQHLSLAKLIKGQYPGTQVQNSHGMCKRGTECPLAPFQNTSYFPITTAFHTPRPFNITKKNVIMIYNGDGHIEILEDGHVSPEDAYSIDQKMDDGIASTGVLITYGTGGFYYSTAGAGWANCLTDSTGLQYNLESTRTVCRPLYTVDR